MTTGSETMRKGRGFKGFLGYAVAVAAVALAVFLLHRTLSQYEWRELVAAITAVSFDHLLLALGFTAASYLCLTGFDWLGLRYAGHPLAYRRAALASFCSLSLGHNIGLAALSSGAIRYRFYSRWGLGAEEVAKVILFCAITVGVGLTILGGVGLLVSPAIAAAVTGLSTATVRMVGAVCIIAPLAYLLLCALFAGRALHFRGRQLALPEFRLALAQLVIGPLNFAFVAAALHQAISALAEVPYLEVVAVYVSANVATLITHVPGGLGVIESVVLYLLPHANLIGAVLVFRFVYFLLPLLVGSILLLSSEIFFSGSRATRSPETS